jgi:hypothetical protein
MDPTLRATVPEGKVITIDNIREDVSTYSTTWFGYDLMPKDYRRLLPNNAQLLSAPQVVESSAL